MNVNVTVETKADVKVYVTTGGSDALESNWTLPPLVEAVEDGHGDVRGRREGRDAESASPRSEPTRGRTICDGEEPRASERTAGRHCADSRELAPLPSSQKTWRAEWSSSDVVELLRGKALCRLPPNSTLRGGSLLQPPLLRNGRSEERVRVSW